MSYLTRSLRDQIARARPREIAGPAGFRAVHTEGGRAEFGQPDRRPICAGGRGRVPEQLPSIARNTVLP